MTPQEFYDQYNGKAIDYDGAYGVQCVDAWRVFCKWLGIPSLPTPNNYADGYWYSRDALGYAQHERRNMATKIETGGGYPLP